ncbi:MAG: acyl-CoA dehydrogenase family protein [Candidatus Binatia bacterium]
MEDDYFLREMELFIDHRVDWQRYFGLSRLEPVEIGGEIATYKAILRTAAEVCEDIAATAEGHWHEEVTLVDGRVVVPPHIAAGYEKLRAAGLVCLTLSPAYNGYGLPLVLNCYFLEMLARADASLMTIVGLQTGTAQDIQHYGTDELRQRYLPRFASGELQGCMDLTEAQAGSDLGGIVTRATEENGRYFLDGEKIFITNGGADVHLVLARDAATFVQSRGTTTGLSLLLCPAILPNGTRNGVRVARVESKLGIHGSPTCVIEFERAEAFLLGERGDGFRAMLDLMNAARLGVAAQAIGIAEGAYRRARAYAAQRVQFDAPILEQPLIKNLLTSMVINIQSARALVYRTCALVDRADALRAHLGSDRGERDPERSAVAQELEHTAHLVRFFTPLCKYYATEISNDVTRKGIQVHGGIGYMAETAAGHYHSDSIITTIYEGTSEIQASFALKEMAKGALFTTLEQTRSELEQLRATYPEAVEQVGAGIQWITDAVSTLLADPQYALLNAKRICKMVVDVVIAAELLLQANLSDAKRELAITFIHRRMLAVEMNARRIRSGDASRIKRYDRIIGLTDGDT